MADITYYVALPFLEDDGGSPVAGTAEECQTSTTALRRAELMHFDEAALELLRYDRAGNLEAEQVEIRERPPIKTIAAYRALHH